jgi:hypothetical protein
VIGASFAGDSSDATSSHAGDLTVTKANPAITWATPAAITYGTPLGTAQLDATASVPGAFAYTPAAGTILHAGAGQFLAATFTPADAIDYSTLTTKVAIDVAPAPLVIIADNKAKLAGQPNPALSTTIIGFVVGDSISSLAAPPVVSTTATTASAAGNYPISAGGAASPNYAISYLPGTLTILASPTPTPTPSPLVAGLTALVDTLYQNLLGHQPDASSLRGWLVKLALGESPQTVASGIAKLGHKVKSSAIKKAVKAALAAEQQAMAGAVASQSVPGGPIKQSVRVRARTPG